MRNRVVTLLLVHGLCACGGYKKALPPIEPPPQSVAPELFKFSDKARRTRLVTILFNLPIGHRYGEIGAGYDGTCYNRQPLVNTKAQFQYEVGKYADLFSNIMKRHGYPVDDEVELFENSKERTADLHIGARIVDATLNACYPDSYKNELKARGSSYLKIEWSVFSTLEKKVVFVTTTEGSTYSEVESTIGEPGILRPAMAVALERLALDPKYRAIVDAPAVQTTADKTTAARIKIKRTREFSGDLKNHIDLIKAAVATITANKGTGSGFVISEDGTVVTAEHVVSGSKLVKVNTAAGKECYGEVVAASKQRDLAIIHLDCAGLTALPVSRQKLVEGGEVFAIGTPLSQKLQFSVTKGVVSGIRKIDDLEYIQSDVTVHPGSSGGPLLDSRGNVVGVTDLGVPTRGGSLNFFIPVTDLEKYVPVDFE
jgi:S1-C subfamily serine protease